MQICEDRHFGDEPNSEYEFFRSIEGGSSIEVTAFFFF
jgi:hypothetical protein